MKEATARKTVDLPSPRHPGGGGVVINLPPRGPTKGHGGGGGGNPGFRTRFPYSIEIISWTSTFKRDLVRGWVVAGYTDAHGIRIRTNRCWLAFSDDEDRGWECHVAQITMPGGMEDDFAIKVTQAVAAKYGAQ